MPVGIPQARGQNIIAATAEAKKRLIETNGDWYAVRVYLKAWLAQRYGLSRTTVADYIFIVEQRLRADADIQKLKKRGL